MTNGESEFKMTAKQVEHILRTMSLLLFNLHKAEY